jgi:outer membrane receptor protein involved in Fe transport
MLTNTRSRLLSSTLLVSAALAAPAFSQTSDPAVTADQGGGDVVVTGTLVRNPNLVASSPINVVGSEEIALRQRNTAEELLRDLPGVVASIGSAVNNGNGGASYVDLRGLGNFRNVVLLDGARIAPSSAVGRVDLNNIPLALVERVDTLTGGAATTYGADAVSGVVNFITRQDFSGVEVNASESLTGRGDGEQTRIDVTVGANFDDGRGNAVLSLGYQNSDPVYQGDRKFSLNNYTSTSGSRGGSSTTVPSRFTLGTTPRQFDPSTGLLRAYNGLTDAFNFNPYNVFQTPFRRFNIYGAGHYDVTDNIQVYTRGMFSKNTVNTIIAPSGLFNTSLTIPVSNPYLPAGARAQFCANNDFDPNTAGIQTLTVAQCNAAAVATDPNDPNFRTFTTTVQRRANEVGPRISEYVTQVFDYRAGVKFGITDSINLDVAGAYGESENRQSLQGYVLTSRMRSAAYATNTTSCLAGAPGGADIGAGSGCVPVNLFGPDGSITAAQIPYITANSTSTNTTSLAQARALLSGDIGWTSPWANEPIAFAAGAEYRKYNAAQDSDSLSQTAGELGGAGGAAPTFKGSYEVYEGYSEIIVPLIADKPFFKSLTVEGGIRYSDYKVFAEGTPKYNTTTYKGGASWEPVDGFKLRGTYQRAVRAPNIAELFSPVNVGLTNLSYDACAGSAPVTNANLRAVCLAQGAPAAAIGNIETPISSQANATTGGNLALRPEKADSYTLGVVLQPDFVPGLSITVDYYYIKINNAISQPTPGDAYDLCFGDPAGGGITAGSATNPACTQIRRDPVSGSLSGDPAVVGGLFLAASNQGKILTDGIDLGINYRRNLGFALLNMSFQGSWTNRAKFQATPVSQFRECVGLYGQNCGSPGSAGPSSSAGSLQPEFTWNQRTTLTFGPLDVSLLWRHIDGMKAEPGLNLLDGTLTGGVLDGKEVNFNRIKAYDYFDFATRIGVNDNVDLTLTIANLLDKAPPLVGGTVGSTSFNSGNTYPSTYDALGRRFTVGIRAKF